MRKEYEREDGIRLYWNSICAGWKLGELIGRGAGGGVYRAFCERYGIEHEAMGEKGFLSEKYCIKVIDTNAQMTQQERMFIDLFGEKRAESLYEDIYRRCIREAVFMEELQECPNIVTAEEILILPGKEKKGCLIGILMKMHECLSDFLRDKDEKTVLQAGIDICKALEALKRQHIIHQDIKAANIFRDKEGNFLLGDFGVAKKEPGFSEKVWEGMDGDLFEADGESGGTLSNLAPEVFWGDQSTHQSDLYSLGLMLYRAMNDGRDPFDAGNCSRDEGGQSSWEAKRNCFRMRMKADALPKPVNASEEFSGIILKACMADPKLRYNDAGEMREDLEHILNGYSEVFGKKKQTDQDTMNPMPLQVRNRQVPERYCRKCGTLADAAAKYCITCGISLEAEADMTGRKLALPGVRAGRKWPFRVG